MRYFFSLFCCFFILANASAQHDQKTGHKAHLMSVKGGIVRGDSTQKKVALVFTADEYGEGLPTIIQTLRKHKIKGSFFFTGRFYKNKAFQKSIQTLHHQDHYLGPHSDEHLLYNDWRNRDSLLVSRDSFEKDIVDNLTAMQGLGLPVHQPHYFIPPYEWWNDSIAVWSKASGLTLFSFTPGIRTNTDYTYPELGTSYKSTEWIMNWLKEFITTSPSKLNGAIILVHAGTDPRRKDKLYDELDYMIGLLKKHGYQFERIDRLLEEKK